MNIIFKRFSFMRERDFYIFVLERTKSDLSKINWLYGIIWFHSNSAGVLGQAFIVSHSYQTSFGFSGSDLSLDYGLRDHEGRISWLGSESGNIILFLVFLFLSSTSIFLCFGSHLVSN
jgi:hypothetical protein